MEERTSFICCSQETGLYEYKVFGVLATCTPELCADVYMDLPYRKQWDGYVKGKELHKLSLDRLSSIQTSCRTQPLIRAIYKTHNTFISNSILSVWLSIDDMVLHINACFIWCLLMHVLLFICIAPLTLT